MKKNPTELDPKKMTEEEIQAHYGPEAPPVLYELVHDQLTTTKELDKICQENVVADFIGFLLTTRNDSVTEVDIMPSDFSEETENRIKSTFLGQRITFRELRDKMDVIPIRLDINKLCQGTDFSPTPAKDSTLKTKPLLKESVRQSREIMNEKIEENLKK